MISCRRRGKDEKCVVTLKDNDPEQIKKFINEWNKIVSEVIFAPARISENEQKTTWKKETYKFSKIMLATFLISIYWVLDGSWIRWLGLLGFIMVGLHWKDE